MRPRLYGIFATRMGVFRPLQLSFHLRVPFLSAVVADGGATFRRMGHDASRAAGSPIGGKMTGVFLTIPENFGLSA